MGAHLAICDGDDGIPLWQVEPTPDNIPRNTIVGRLEPYEPCVVLLDLGNGTCVVAFDGVLAYAVTACLYEVL